MASDAAARHSLFKGGTDVATCFLPGCGQGVQEPRRPFSSEQVKILTEEYDRSLYVTPERCAELAAESDLTVKQVAQWFRNRRRNKNEWVTVVPEPVDEVGEATTTWLQKLNNKMDSNKCGSKCLSSHFS
ncbi:homeobox protein DLL homolog [Sparus aurata]|uniref:homeobox protein DLL homolog n=1 Tax=Sparus aurata TaxID=8175 RepID=UPI0011C121C1|nr:homeobox protein DLL homolog [Sparus aurata]